MLIETTDLKYLKFEESHDEHIVSLIDSSNYEISKGYGSSVTDAVNDLLSNII